MPKTPSQRAVPKALTAAVELPLDLKEAVNSLQTPDVFKNTTLLQLSQLITVVTSIEDVLETLDVRLSKLEEDVTRVHEQVLHGEVGTPAEELCDIERAATILRKFYSEGRFKVHINEIQDEYTRLHGAGNYNGLSKRLSNRRHYSRNKLIGSFYEENFWLKDASTVSTDLFGLGTPTQKAVGFIAYAVRIMILPFLGGGGHLDVRHRLTFPGTPPHLLSLCEQRRLFLRCGNQALPSYSEHELIGTLCSSYATIDPANIPTIINRDRRTDYSNILEKVGRARFAERHDRSDDENVVVPESGSTNQGKKPRERSGGRLRKKISTRTTTSRPEQSLEEESDSDNDETAGAGDQDSLGESSSSKARDSKLHTESPHSSQGSVATATDDRCHNESTDSNHNGGNKAQGSGNRAQGSGNKAQSSGDKNIAKKAKGIDTSTSSTKATQIGSDKGVGGSEREKSSVRSAGPTSLADNVSEKPKSASRTGSKNASGKHSGEHTNCDRGKVRATQGTVAKASAGNVGGDLNSQAPSSSSSSIRPTNRGAIRGDKSFAGAGSAGIDHFTV